jgi:enediyne biosynthesis protein E7
MIYLNTRMVLDETMRCYPVIWSYGRKALKDDVVNDYFIPAGTNLSISVYNIHHNPIYWEQPGLFYPERFAPEKDRLRERFAFIPFGAGPRICIGSHFALIEAFLILPMILQKYKLQLISKDPIKLKPMIALRPAEKMMMTVKTR